MIRAQILHEDSDGVVTEIAAVRIERMDSGDLYSDYVAEFVLNRGSGNTGLHRRSVLSYPRRKYNGLALLYQAIKTLDREALELDGDPDSSTVARRRSRAMRALQAWESRLRNN